MQTNGIDQLSVPTNTVLHGDCISIMRSLPANSIEFILTDPPYLVRYQDRQGRSIQNDCNSDWLVPSFSESIEVVPYGLMGCVVAAHSMYSSTWRSRRSTQIETSFRSAIKRAGWT